MYTGRQTNQEPTQAVRVTNRDSVCTGTARRTEPPIRPQVKLGALDGPKSTAAVNTTVLVRLFAVDSEALDPMTNLRHAHVGDVLQPRTSTPDIRMEKRQTSTWELGRQTMSQPGRACL